jgi:hypothetical protein
MKGKRSAFIYFWYQTGSGVPNTSIYLAVSLASPYYNYLWSIASTTMICWRCHSNSVNTGSSLPYLSDVQTRNRRNVVGIDMIRNYLIRIWLWQTTSNRTSPVTEVEQIVYNLNCSRTFYPEISTLEYCVIFETIVINMKYLTVDFRYTLKSWNNK